MRHLKTFKKAYVLHQGGFVKEVERTKNKSYFSVENPDSHKEHMLTMALDDETKTIRITCTCTQCSIKSKHQPLCPYKMATIMRAVYDLGRKKENGKQI